MIQPHEAGGAVENSQHDAFAVFAWQRRHAGVDQTPSQTQRDAPVLGQPGFGNVQARHHLEPRDDLAHWHVGAVHGRLQETIDAHPHAQAPLMRLHMQVGGASGDGAAQERVDQLDHGGVFGVLQQVALTALPCELPLIFEIKEQIVAILFAASLIKPGQACLERHLGFGAQVDRAPRPAARLAQAGGGSVRACDQGGAVQRNLVVAGECEGQAQAGLITVR